MPNHDLRRNADSEPVCVCGYRPTILDDYRAWNKTTKAKTAVLNHAKSLNKYEAAADALAASQPMDASIRFAEDVLEIELQPWQKQVLRRSPDAPFELQHARYPRAGVRQMEDGRWKLMGWDGADIAHVITNDACFVDREEACEVGRMIIGAHRESGTRLNGMEA